MKDEETLPERMVGQTGGEDHSTERDLSRQRIWIITISMLS